VRPMKQVFSVITLVGLSVALLTAGEALSEETIRLAVFNLQPIGVDQATVLTTAQLLRNDLAGTGRFSVVEEGEMQRVLGQSAMCYDSQCAAENGRRLEVQKAIVGSLSRLGEKIIVELRLVDVSTAGVEYSDRMASTTVEDLDTVIQRMARAVAAGKPVEKTAEVGSIVQEEAKEPLRRKNFFTVGGKIGYLFPTGDSWGQADRLLCLDWVTRYETPSFFVESLVGYRYQLNEDNGAFDVPIEFSIFYIPSRSDFSPYFGGGLGIHWIGAKRWDEDGEPVDDEDERWTNNGLALNLGGGLMGFRTYDFRIVVDLRYSVVLADLGGQDTHQGIGLTFGITSQRGGDKGPRGCCLFNF
jgi:TolB-like protein